MTSPARKKSAIKLQPGTHPTAEQAASIVLTSCAPEFPKATLADSIGKLYPLPDQRSTFSDRIVDNSKDNGFTIAPSKIPLGDNNTLRDVSNAVQTNAVA
jgi:hypothetical protein